jgi:hypothetical protein
MVGQGGIQRQGERASLSQVLLKLMLIYGKKRTRFLSNNQEVGGAWVPLPGEGGP